MRRIKTMMSYDEEWRETPRQIVVKGFEPYSVGHGYDAKSPTHEG